jgi:hypothetical protein
MGMADENGETSYSARVGIEETRGSPWQWAGWYSGTGYWALGTGHWVGTEYLYWTKENFLGRYGGRSRK